MRASEGLRQAEGEAEGWGLVTGDAHSLYALEHGVEELPMAILTMVLLTVALLTMALLTMALLTMARLTLALLTLALLAMALLSIACLMCSLRSSRRTVAASRISLYAPQ